MEQVWKGSVQRKGRSRGSPHGSGRCCNIRRAYRPLPIWFGMMFFGRASSDVSLSWSCWSSFVRPACGLFRTHRQVSRVGTCAPTGRCNELRDFRCGNGWSSNRWVGNSVNCPRCEQDRSPYARNLILCIARLHQLCKLLPLAPFASLNGNAS